MEFFFSSTVRGEIWSDDLMCCSHAQKFNAFQIRRKWNDVFTLWKSLTGFRWMSCQWSRFGIHGLSSTAHLLKIRIWSTQGSQNIYDWKYSREKSFLLFFQHCRVIFPKIPSCVAKTFEDGVYVTSSESIHLSIEKPNTKPVPHWLNRMETEPDEILEPGLSASW